MHTQDLFALGLTLGFFALALLAYLLVAVLRPVNL